MNDLTELPVADLAEEVDGLAGAVQPKRLTGELLVESGAVTRAQLDICLEEQYRLRQEGRDAPIGSIILQNRFATSAEIANAIEISSGIQVGGELPWPLRRRYRFVVAGTKNDVLQVASVSPLSEQAKSTILAAAKSAGFHVSRIERSVSMDKKTILRSLKKGSHVEHLQMKSFFNALSSDPDDGSIIQKIIENLFVDAMQMHASDIHITRDDENAGNWIDFRVDGTLTHRYLVARQAMAPLATRIKNESGMDMGETRRPQDGRMSFEYMGRGLDLRVSSIPRDGGESIVIRILDQDTLKPITELFALYPRMLLQLDRLTSIKRKTGGLIFATGATGSGKTSTLYAILSEMDRSLLKIMTAEDPIEYRLPLVTQTQVNEAISLSFANILRAQMRQDPDVLVVGEMRDQPTAKIALQSAESGHMLLSTLHTDDVMQAITKVIGLLPDDYKTSGIYVLASMMRAILNQRLVPRLCECATRVRAADLGAIYTIATERLALTPESMVRVSNGCARCRQTGYSGRVMAPEALFISAEPGTRAAVTKILIDNQTSITIENFKGVAGVEYFPRDEAARSLVLGGVIDLETALTALEIPYHAARIEGIHPDAEDGEEAS